MSNRLKPTYLRILNILLIITLLTFIIPDTGKFRYDYMRGRPWIYETLVAPVDFPVLKTGSEMRRERESAAKSIIPRYRFKENSLDYIGTLDSSDNREIKSIIGKITLAGIADYLPDYENGGGVLGVVRDDKLTFVPTANVYTIESAYDKLTASLKERFPDRWEEILKATEKESIKANLLFDELLTQKAVKDAVSDISPTKGMIYSGQLIVSKGEMVTAETEQLLDSYKHEYELTMGYSGSKYLLKLGHFVISALIVIFLVLLLHYLKKEIITDRGKLNFFMLLLLLSAFVTSIVNNYGANYLYVIPYSVIALYITSFFTSKIVLPLYSVILLPLFLITSGGAELYLMNLAAGGAVFYTFHFWDRGWLQFINSLVVFIALAVIYTALKVIDDGTLSSADPNSFVFFAWNSTLVIAAYPLLFLFEKLFGLVSNSKLKDLSDATSPVLALLAEKAPGTFHHSLQVANLAEGAAREIGAYALLARVGGLYHDIGKMNNPSFFIENQPAGENSAHIGLSPEESARVIIQHLEEGVAIAKKERIPQIIVDFIRSHHGTSQTSYFYNRFLNSGGDPSNVSLFTYKGVLPKYKEQVIVMLADAVEAASRSLKMYSKESISALVEKIVDERISEKQLSESDISLSEINKVKELFKRRISQVYHSRIVYPEKLGVNKSQKR